MRIISEYMVKDPIAVPMDSSLSGAVAVMREKGIGAVLINDPQGQTIGIFTERDLLNRINFEDPEHNTGLKIKDVMTSNLVMVDHAQPYNVVLDMMKTKNLRHLPVTRDGQVIGIVSLRDMMNRYEENLEALLQQKENQLLENMARIQESEERFRTIFNNSAVAIMFADNNERIISWNPLAEELLGMGASEIYNKPVSEIYPPQEWQRIRSYNLRQKGERHHLEVKIQNKNGELIDVDLSISVLKDPAGRVVGSIGIMNDIRQRKMIEESLKRSREQLALSNKDLEANAKVLKEMVLEREKTNRKLRETQRQIIQVEKMATIGTLAAGFAHEIKNPLAIILQGLERMERALKKQQDQDDLKYLRVMQDAAQRANNVIVSILQYSRTAEIEVKPVNVYDVLDSTLDLVQNAAKTRNVLIQKKYARVSYLVSGNGVMLQQVFFDLIMNAMDAMPEGGNIDITIDFHPSREEDQEAGDFVIRVRDNGLGMDSQQLTKIFDPFYTTKEVGKGTGLGLSTVFLIIDKHHGHITVESQKGEGTVFTITLPAA